MILRQGVHLSHLYVGTLLLRQYTICYRQRQETDMILHVTRLWICSFKVHDPHLIDLSLEWYRDVYT